jgi:hypothetical protein
LLRWGQNDFVILEHRGRVLGFLKLSDEARFSASRGSELLATDAGRLG